MPAPSPEVIDRKLAVLRGFIADLAGYARLDAAGRRRRHPTRVPQGPQDIHSGDLRVCYVHS